MIREEVDDYSASADYWIRCLYEGEQGDPADVEKGFLKSGLLVKVRVHPSLYHPFPAGVSHGSLTGFLPDFQIYIHIAIFGRR